MKMHFVINRWVRFEKEVVRRSNGFPVQMSINKRKTEQQSSDLLSPIHDWSV